MTAARGRQHHAGPPPPTPLPSPPTQTTTRNKPQRARHHPTDAQ